MSRLRVTLSLLTLSLLLSVSATPQSRSAVVPDATLAAATAFTYGQYYSRIVKINVGADYYLWINVAGNLTSKHGCATPYFARSKYPLNDERTKAWLQISTTSFNSQKRAYLETTGCTAVYGGEYPILTKLQVEQQ